MTSMIATTQILKQDASGRVRVPVERRRALLEEFESSGSSAAQFARLTGIKYHTFITWVQKQRKERARESGATGCGPPTEEKDLGARGGPVRLFEALVEGGNCGGRASGGLVVELPGGSRMEVDSPVHAQLAAELVVLIAQRAGVRC
jgi:hypothetical protein